MKPVKIFTLFAILFLCSCALYTGEHQRNWQRDGGIIVSRPAPAISPASQQRLLAFMPVDNQHTGHWLEIDTTSNSLSLMDGDSQIASITSDNLKSLIPGTYTIAHKQVNALWHAPDRYYQMRNLPVPAPGSTDRYLRGALGKYVIYLNADLPIHSGPLDLSSVSDVQIDEQSLSKMYYHLDIGGVVEVK